MAEFRKNIKVVLFLSSYVPLFLILAIKLSSTPPLVFAHIGVPRVDYIFDISWWSVVCVTCSGLLVGGLWFVLWFHSGHRTDLKRCNHFQQRNELISSYLLVYVFVFVGLDFAQPGEWLIFILFFGMLAVLQMNSEMLHINPLLGLRGYRVYEVESSGETLLVISKDDIRESIKTPESQKEVSDPKFRNIEVIPLGANAYLTPSNHERSKKGDNEAKGGT